MNEKKWFITQAVLFVIYLSMTMIFLVGWNQIMYSEENANALVSIVTGIYFGAADSSFRLPGLPSSSIGD